MASDNSNLREAVALQARSYNGHRTGWVVHYKSSQLMSRVKFCKQSMRSLASNQPNLPCINNSLQTSGDQARQGYMPPPPLFTLAEHPALSSPYKLL